MEQRPKLTWGKLNSSAEEKLGRNLQK